ncbi:MAG: DUF5009 domain-containing protein [Bacteroidaceae bacterium]|nr:DUF5009 domain-containing protein [Bacteroidaceae bacterium]
MKRLESLDALRGFDMLFIMGGATLFAAIAACFPESGFWTAFGEQMEHVDWEGLQHHDTIFPLFLFIAGCSFPFSLAAQQEHGKTQKEIVSKIIRRGLTLVVLGLIYNGLLNFNFATARFCSVLARIGLGWMFAALIYTRVKDFKKVAGIIAAILIGYWLIMAFVPAPGAPADADIFSIEGSIACWIDRVILGAHSYRPDYDPEGLISTIPAIGTALMGMLSGAYLKNSTEDGTRKAITLAIAGVIMALVGWGWGFFFPIIKALWTSSFVCAVAGYSLIMLALFYYIIDVRGWRGWDKFFVVIGMNSITIYLAQAFIPFTQISRNVFGGLASLFPENWAAVVIYAGYIAVCWLFLYFLYKKKVFLKV